MKLVLENPGPPSKNPAERIKLRRRMGDMDAYGEMMARAAAAPEKPTASEVEESDDEDGSDAIMHRSKEHSRRCGAKAQRDERM